MNLLFNISKISKQFRLNVVSQVPLIKSLNPLRVRNEDGHSKVLLCPDTRENLEFSVQTGVSRLKKILSAILTAARA